VTSATCSGLLFRAYARRNALRLLLSAAICFAFLALQNALLFIDIVVLPPSVNLSAVRALVGVIGVLALLFGILTDGR
jgi:hypothetical protein